MRTEALESRETTLARALEPAWSEASRRPGGDPARWSYGEVHRWRPRHALGIAPVVGRFLDRAARPVPGSDTSPCVFTGSWNGASELAEVRHGASLRFVADCGDPDRSLAILPGGQSGHPFDPGYDDQLERYLSGSLRPMRWSEASIAAATRSRLVLVP